MISSNRPSEDTSLPEASPSTRRAKLVLVVLVAVLVVFGALFGEPVWRGPTSKRIPYPLPGEESQWHEDNIQGWYTVRRWSRTRTITKHGTQRMFYVDTGLKAFEGEYEDGYAVQETHWNGSGKVIQQYERRAGSPQGTWKTSPPWLWGVEDQ